MTYTYKKNSDGHYVCPNCGVTKERQNTMHYHMKTHEGRLPYECNFCSKQFLQAYTLEIHKKTQHEREQNELNVCPIESCSYKGTVTKSNLLIHFVRKHCSNEADALLSVNNGIYHCTQCKKEMKSSTAFYYHVSSCIRIDDETRLKQFNAIRDI